MSRKNEFRVGLMAIVLVAAVTLTGCLLSDEKSVPMKLPDQRQVRMWRGELEEDDPPPFIVASAVTTESTLPATAADALARIGKAAVPQLIVALGDADPQVRAYAAESLGLMGRDAAESVPALMKLLNDREDRVRRAAAKSLGQIGPASEPAVGELIRALHAPDVVKVPDPEAPALY